MKKNKLLFTALIAIIFIFNISVSSYASVINTEKRYMNDDSAPILLITEAVPYSTSDKYEFIEVYNNSDKDINLKDYQLSYRYPNDGSDSDLSWKFSNENTIIKTGALMVFWIVNSKNSDKTVEDFNNNYGTNLVEGTNIEKLYGTSMSNSGYRGYAITTNTGVDIDSAVYHDKNIAQDKGITYKYPGSGTAQSILSGGKKKATPGTVTSNQIPSSRVHISDDSAAPTIQYDKNDSSINSTKDYTMKVKASDDNAVKSVFLFYKFDSDNNFTQVKMRFDKNLTDVYDYKFVIPDLLGKKYIQYYFTACDGTNESKSDIYQSSIDGNNQYLWLNVKDGQYVSRTINLKASSNSFEAFATDISVDGAQQFDTYDALEDKAYFSFEINRTRPEYKNGVLMNNKVIKALNSEIVNYTTITIPIKDSDLKIGKNNTISVRSGSRLGLFGNDGNNRNDFYIRNARLTLPNGYQIRPTQAAYADPAKIINVGDDSGPNSKIQVNFKFFIDNNILYTRACKLDTKKMTDGPHTVEAYLNNTTVASKIYVDNTSPVIEPLFNTKKTYKGKIKIDFNIYDDGAGIKDYSVKLDKKSIMLPYSTSGALLATGKHNITVTAKDEAGNVATKTFSINVTNQSPKPPEKVDIDGAKDNEINVKVEDPSNDKMNLTFYRAYKYSGQSMKVYQGEADKEPPNEKDIPGENELTADQLQQINALDGSYAETSSTSKFPYQRFDINVDQGVSKDSIVDINWNGKSLPGRFVTMYAWNIKTNRWEMLTRYEAGNEAFKLSAKIAAGNYIDNDKIHVLVQDRNSDNQTTNSDESKFTFVWMSDTQYYCQYKPNVYDSINNWIVQNKDSENIKYCIHTGDIVNNYDNEGQWNNADKSMKILDNAKIPYGVLAGNHDVDDSKTNYKNYDKYFGSSRFAGRDYYGGSYDDNKGHYDLISAGNNDFIILYMGWGIDDKEIAWMNKVLKENPNRKAILCFHEYLLEDGQRSLVGEKVFKKVVIPNKNVMMVLCGHNSNTINEVDNIDDNNDGTPDRKVYQILCDYQSGDGGDGFVTLMQFDTANNKINVKTYSPYLNKYNYYDPVKYPGKDTYSLDMNLQQQNKLVATDSIEAEVYTKSVLASFKNVKSGSVIKATIKPTLADQNYCYAVAEDEYGGRSESDILKVGKD